MPIRNVQFVLAIAGTALLASGQSASAFDPDKVFGADPQASIVLQYGNKALRDGRTDDAIGAFRLGAAKNNVQSQWKLARMLQTGRGISQNQLAAYELYEKIADRYEAIPPSRRDRPFVSNANVQLGKANLVGIEGSRVKLNPFLAEHYLHRAAAIFGDAEAQYQLGRLYSSELLGPKRPRTAAGWYELACKKGHVNALAEFGDMLFHGKGIRPNRVRGLVYLTRAAAGSARGRVESVRQMQWEAFQMANNAQKNAAQRIVSKLNIFPPKGDNIGPQEQLSVFGLNTDASRISE